MPTNSSSASGFHGHLHFSAESENKSAAERKTPKDLFIIFFISSPFTKTVQWRQRFSGFKIIREREVRRQGYGRHIDARDNEEYQAYHNEYDTVRYALEYPDYAEQEEHE